MSTFLNRFKLLASQTKGVIVRGWRWFSGKVKTRATKTRAKAQKIKVKTIQFVKTTIIPMIKKYTVRLMLALGFLIAVVIVFTMARGNKIPTEATSEGIWFVAIGLVALSFLILRSFKKKKKSAGRDAHGDGHGHGHDHAHPEGFALLWSGIKKAGWFPWLVVILIIYMIPKVWSQWFGPEKPPVTLDYTQYEVKADIVGTGLLSYYILSAYGPDRIRLDSVYNTGMFFDWDPSSKEGTCGYYGGGTGKLKVDSFTKPTPLSFLVMAKRQKQGSTDEWEEVKIEGKGSL